MIRQREEENEENRLSEEAERAFDRSQGDQEDGAVTVAAGGGRLDAAGTPADATYQIESESQAPRSTITVPAIVTAT